MFPSQFIKVWADRGLQMSHSVKPPIQTKIWSIPIRDAGIRNDESMMFEKYFLQMNSLINDPSLPLQSEEQEYFRIISKVKKPLNIWLQRIQEFRQTQWQHHYHDGTNSVRYLLNVRQQFGDDGVGYFVHSVQSRDDGGGVEGEDDSELGAASRVSRVRLKNTRTGFSLKLLHFQLLHKWKQHRRPSAG